VLTRLKRSTLACSLRRSEPYTVIDLFETNSRTTPESLGPLFVKIGEFLKWEAEVWDLEERTPFLFSVTGVFSFHFRTFRHTPASRWRQIPYRGSGVATLTRQAAIKTNALELTRQSASWLQRQEMLGILPTLS